MDLPAKLSALLDLARRRRADLRLAPAACWTRALARLGQSAATRGLFPAVSWRQLLTAHRELLHCRGALAERLRNALEAEIARRLPGPAAEAPPMSAEDALALLDAELPPPRGPYALALKAPGPGGERGVLMAMDRWTALPRMFDLPRLQRDYWLVIEPSWTGIARADLFAFRARATAPVLVFAPYAPERRFLQRLGGLLRPVVLGSGDWVHPEDFRPLPGRTRRWDAIMTSRWAPYKRHHVFLRAIAALRDPGYRALLVGFERPEQRAEARALIDLYGLGGSVELRGSVEHPELNALLNGAGVQVLTSLIEGSNRALFEGLFAGVPALALAENVGLPRRCFGSATGRLVPEAGLTAALAWFRRHADSFAPRPWALAELAPERSLATLDKALAGLAREAGEPWRGGMVGKVNRHGFHYYPDASAGAGLPTLRELLGRYGR